MRQVATIGLLICLALALACPVADPDDDAGDDDVSSDDDLTGDDDDLTNDDDDATGDDDDTADDDDSGDDDDTTAAHLLEVTITAGQPAPSHPAPHVLGIALFAPTDFDPLAPDLIGPHEPLSFIQRCDALPATYAATALPGNAGSGAEVWVVAFLDDNRSGLAAGPDEGDRVGWYPSTVTLPAGGLSVALDHVFGGVTPAPAPPILDGAVDAGQVQPAGSGPHFVSVAVFDDAAFDLAAPFPVDEGEPVAYWHACGDLPLDYEIGAVPGVLDAGDPVGVLAFVDGDGLDPADEPLTGDLVGWHPAIVTAPATADVALDQVVP